MNAEELNAALGLLASSIASAQDVWIKLDNHRMAMVEAEAKHRLEMEAAEKQPTYVDEVATHSDRLTEIEKRLDNHNRGIAADRCCLATIEERLGEIDGRLNAQTRNIEALRKRIANTKPAPPTNAELREGARKSGNHPPGPPWSQTDNPFTPEPAPAVEVEMQTFRTEDQRWSWKCRLTAQWTFADPGSGRYDDREYARSGGNGWLAALGDQLGINLIPKWTTEPAADAG